MIYEFLKPKANSGQEISSSLLIRKITNTIL
jgi:hypothetical protein